MATQAEQLIRAIDGLTGALKEVEEAKVKEAERRAREAERKADDKEKEKRQKEDADRRSNPLAKLIGAYRSSGMAGQGIVSGAMTGNVTGAIQGVMNAGQQVSTAQSAVSGILGDGAAGAAGGAAVGVAAAFVAVGFAVYEFKAAMDAATKQTIAHYRELSKTSGGMAGVMAQRDLREMMRDQEVGNRLAGVASQLTNAEQDRADAGKEIDIAWEELKAGFLTAFNQTMTQILAALTEMLGLAQAEFGGEVQMIPDTLGEMLDKSADQAERDLGRNRQLPPLGQFNF